MKKIKKEKRKEKQEENYSQHLTISHNGAEYEKDNTFGIHYWLSYIILYIYVYTLIETCIHNVPFKWVCY